MFCLNCGSLVVKILGEKYCPNCKKEVHGADKVSFLENKPKKNHNIKTKGKELSLSDNIRTIFFGLFSTLSFILFTFIFFSFFLNELSELARILFLILTGISSGIVGGAVMAKINPKDYIKNSICLALILVLVNVVFNIMYDFNIFRSFFSLFLGAIIYPIPFILGSLIYIKTKAFK